MNYFFYIYIKSLIYKLFEINIKTKKIYSNFEYNKITEIPDKIFDLINLKEL